MLVLLVVKDEEWDDVRDRLKVAGIRGELVEGLVWRDARAIGLTPSDFQKFMFWYASPGRPGGDTVVRG